MFDLGEEWLVSLHGQHDFHPTGEDEGEPEEGFWLEDNV